eukprot:maker-scaffold1269_size51662-snap-gene-0.12 protein:Tk10475 transcript:maker-scaffold1269_size51662-snap-gene-0.12-mRNA-1 annotation:"polyamine-modulated factor 1-like"
MSTEEASLRYSLLQKCQEKSKQKWRKLQDQRLSDFTALLPEVIRKDQNFVTQLHRQLMAQIDQGIGEAFQERFDEWELETKLKKLDQIEADCQEAGRAQNAWRPSGNPDDDLAAHHTQMYLDEFEKLDGDLHQGLRTEVTDLHAEVDKLWQAIETNKKGIQTILEHPLSHL